MKLSSKYTSVLTSLNEILVLSGLGHCSSFSEAHKGPQKGLQGRIQVGMVGWGVGVGKKAGFDQGTLYACMESVLSVTLIYVSLLFCFCF